MSKQGEGHSRKKNKNKKKLDRAVSHAGARYQESASPFFRRLRIHIGSAVAYLSRRRRHATTMCAVLVRFSINHPFRIRTQLRVCVSPLPPPSLYIRPVPCVECCLKKPAMGLGRGRACVAKVSAREERAVLTTTISLKEEPMLSAVCRSRISPDLIGTTTLCSFL